MTRDEQILQKLREIKAIMNEFGEKEFINLAILCGKDADTGKPETCYMFNNRYWEKEDEAQKISFFLREEE